MPKKLFTAIVFMEDAQQQPKKYRNIANLNSFRTFAESISGSYYNLYDKSTKLFVERIYIKKGQ
jgi:hypothetical protein